MAEGWWLRTQEHRLCIATQKIWERRQLIKENLTEAQCCFGRGGRNYNTQKERIKTETRSTSSLTPMRLFTCSFYFLLGRRERNLNRLCCPLRGYTAEWPWVLPRVTHVESETFCLPNWRPGISASPVAPRPPRWQSEEPSHPHSRTSPGPLMGENVNSLKV